nr:MAG TPA: hypothetical protein [Caudoviricetes sp.]
MNYNDKVGILSTVLKSKSFSENFVIQLGDLFLKSNDGKTMIYSYSYKSSEKEKMEEYLNLLPNDLDSMNSLIDRFLNDGIRISKSNFETIEDLYSLEQFKRSENKRAQLDLVFYTTSVGYFKRVTLITLTMLIWSELMFLSLTWLFERFDILLGARDTQQVSWVTIFIKLSIVMLVFWGLIIAVMLVILRERLKIINAMKKDVDSKGNNIINFRNIKIILFSHTDHNRFTFVFLSQYNKILESDLQLINF